jgi:peptide/nickel transport system permease protein
MWQYLVRRVLGGLLVLWLVSLFVFIVIRALPGDVLLVLLQEAGHVPEEQMQAARAELGLDDPAPLAYLKWMGGALRGDLGESLYQTGVPVSERLGKAVIPTLQLAVMASMIGVPLSISIGMLAGLRQDTWLDYPVRLVAIAALAVPNFVFALLMLMFFSRQFQYAPPFGWVNLWEDPWKNLGILWMPVLISGLTVSGTLTRMTRSQVIEVMRQDYVRTARAKGLAGRTVISRHIMRNALISVTTILGFSLIAMFSGSVIMEQLFAIPGVGRLTLQSIQVRDYTQIMANTMFYATIVVVANLLIDLMYSVIDPRVHLGARQSA